MDAHSVIQQLGDSFDRWFRHIVTSIENGRIRLTGSYSLPTQLRLAESPTHFVAELCGFTRPRTAQAYFLQKPRTPERIPNTSAFLNPGFDVDDSQEPVIRLAAKHNHFESLALCTAYDREVFRKKFDLELRGVQLIYPKAQVPLVITPRCDYCVFRDVDVVRTQRSRVTFRTIATALVFRTHHTRGTLTKWLASLLRVKPKSPDLFGVNLGVDPSTEQLARQLQSLTDQDIGERVIDRFLESHSEGFATALGYRAALPKKTLRWIERADTDPEQSVPDYLMLRGDRYCDILDLKRAALKYRSVTVGRRGRERVNAYLAELIAQLNGYRRYFAYEKNRKWALSECGVEVNDPVLIGVVGNHDSFRRESVDVALEPYKDHIVLLSYADVIDLLRRRT